MLKPLRILIVDDSQADAILIIDEFRSNGYDISWDRVDTKETFAEAILQKEYDVILCDYVMPTFSAMDALTIAKGLKVDIPFIIISGMLSDEIAPELIRSGAADFISKDEMTKVVAAVEREIKRRVEELEAKITEAKNKAANGSGAVNGKVHLRRRLIIAMAAVFVVIAAEASLFFVTGSDKARELAFAGAQERASAMAAAITGFAEDGGMIDTDSIKQYLSPKNQEPGTIAAFFDAAGTLIAPVQDRNAPPLPAAAGLEAKKAALVHEPYTVSVKTTENGRHSHRELVFTPVNSSRGRLIGVLMVDYTRELAGFYRAGFEYMGLFGVFVLAIISIMVLVGHLNMRSLLNSIKQLELAMQRVAAGDLESDIKPPETREFMELASVFENMKQKTKQNMEHLKREISERELAEQALQTVHMKLTKWVGELDRRTHEITLLNQMGKMLQSCKSVDEFQIVTLRYAEQLFPEAHGAVYLYNETGKFMESMCMWGKDPIEHSFSTDDCWGLRNGHLYAADAPENLNMLCRHIRARDMERNQVTSICVPMMAQGETIGLFHIRSIAVKETDKISMRTKRNFAREQLVGAVAEHITLALSNLKLQDTLRQQSIMDSLTGLYNRRYMKDTLDRELYRAKRHGSPFSVIMLDIDHFKKYNDTFGHETGDIVLERLGKIVKMQVRPEDIACRFGGEEFLVILPGTQLDGAYQCANRILSEARKVRIESGGLLTEGITVSLGVASYPKNGTNADQLLKSADNALYAAKHGGRDMIVLSTEETHGDQNVPMQ